MAKKKSSQPWWKSVDSDEIREALEEATVDCYDEPEQIMGLAGMVDSELEFPFAAIAMGQAVSVTGAAESQHDATGLDLTCEFQGKEYPLPATHVELVEPLPEGHRYLAAYLEWKVRF